jgi:hypothetical protein
MLDGELIDKSGAYLFECGIKRGIEIALRYRLLAEFIEKRKNYSGDITYLQQQYLATDTFKEEYQRQFNFLMQSKDAMIKECVDKDNAEFAKSETAIL